MAGDILLLGKIKTPQSQAASVFLGFNISLCANRQYIPGILGTTHNRVQVLVRNGYNARPYFVFVEELSCILRLVCADNHSRFFC
jgi:hypothetical protein